MDNNCHAWENWDLANTTFRHPPSAVQVEARDFNAPFFNHQPDVTPHYFHSDPHLTCLNLGKRHHVEDDHHVATSTTKKCRTSAVAAAAAVAPPILPRCRVEGCHVALLNAKDYHRRHKVCEIHAKAPKVVVHGIEQRFCQQCSRFHSVSEFDESKRSCRRRLAGHNLRRRKNTQHHSLPPPRPYPVMEEDVGSRRHALSLLSNSNSWIPSSALHDLIAEKRAINLHHHHIKIAYPTRKGSVRYLGNYVDRVNVIPGLEQYGVDLTLDLLRVAPSSEFGLLKSGEECSASWKLPLGY